LKKLIVFFQAEDGIRDFHVTRVQTCALPILVAVDARTGQVAWEVDTIEGDRHDPLNRFSITMPPRIAKGKVFIGASGAEYGVREIGRASCRERIEILIGT